MYFSEHEFPPGCLDDRAVQRELVYEGPAASRDEVLRTTGVGEDFPAVRFVRAAPRDLNVSDPMAAEKGEDMVLDKPDGVLPLRTDRRRDHDQIGEVRLQPVAGRVAQHFYQDESRIRPQSIRKHGRRLRADCGRGLRLPKIEL
ncbi:hypothetical protein GCM10010378_25390 [Streptomyces viridochromogenes]